MSYPFPERLSELYSFTEKFIYSLLGKNITILDIGCGDGLLDKRIVDHADVKITAIDNDRNILEIAKKRNNSSRISYREFDGESNDLPSLGLFDLVLLRNTFHHFQRKEMFLTSVKYLLKPGGRLLIIDLDKEANFSFYGLPIPLCITFCLSLIHNGLIRTLKIALDTQLFLRKDFRLHRRVDKELLKKTRWYSYKEIRMNFVHVFPNIRIGRIGSLWGLGGCYYVIFEEKE